MEQLGTQWDRLLPYLQDRRIQALLALVFAFSLAKLIDLLVCGVLRRLAARTTTQVDDRAIAVLHRPIIWSVALIGITVAANTMFGIGGLPFWVAASLKTIGALIWSVTLSRLIVSFLVFAGSDRAAGLLQPRTLPLFVNLTKLLAVGGATYLIFLAWKIDISAWLASAGIVGIALGFAAKDSLANVFSGIVIITDAPYRVGDFIHLDTGERGEVTKIGLRSTRILTRDDVELTIPNSIMGNTKITNESGGPYIHFRVAAQASAAYGSDVDQVRDVLMGVAKDCRWLRDHPEPRVRFRSLGDSGLHFELLGWIERPQDRGIALDELNEMVYKRFVEHGIEIPYPKRDVYVRQLPSSGGLR